MSMTANQRTVLEAVRAEPADIDTLAQRTGLDVRSVARAAVALAYDDRVILGGGNGPIRPRPNKHEPARFTARAYLRSHGRSPRGRGAWCFQRAAAESAFVDELYGNVVTITGPCTLGAAKVLLKTQHGGGLWAVLP